MIVILLAFFITNSLNSNSEKIGTDIMQQEDFASYQAYFETCVRESCVFINSRYGIDGNLSIYEKYLNIEVQKCMFTFFDEKVNDKVNFDNKISSKMDVNDQTVIVFVHYPVIVSNGNSKFEFRDYVYTFSRTEYTDIKEDATQETASLKSTDNNVIITIPKGTSVKDDKGFYVTNLAIKINDKHFDGLNNGVVATNVVYEGLPNNVTFSNPVEISFSINAVPEQGFYPESLVIAYFDEDLRIWRALPTVFIGGTYKTNTTHFTNFALVKDCGSSYSGNNALQVKITTSKVFVQKYSECDNSILETNEMEKWRVLSDGRVTIFDKTENVNVPIEECKWNNKFYCVSNQIFSKEKITFGKDIQDGCNEDFIFKNPKEPFNDVVTSGYQKKECIGGSVSDDYLVKLVLNDKGDACIGDYSFSPVCSAGDACELCSGDDCGKEIKPKLERLGYSTSLSITDAKVENIMYNHIITDEKTGEVIIDPEKVNFCADVGISAKITGTGYNFVFSANTLQGKSLEYSYDLLCPYREGKKDFVYDPILKTEYCAVCEKGVYDGTSNGCSGTTYGDTIKLDKDKVQCGNRLPAPCKGSNAGDFCQDSSTGTGFCEWGHGFFGDACSCVHSCDDECLSLNEKKSWVDGNKCTNEGGYEGICKSCVCDQNAVVKPTNNPNRCPDTATDVSCRSQIIGYNCNAGILGFGKKYCSTECTCTDDSPKNLNIAIPDLVASPSDYNNQHVELVGYPEYIGETSFWILKYYCQLEYDGKDWKCNWQWGYSEVTLTTHSLHEEPNLNSPYINVVETENNMNFFLKYDITLGSVYDKKIKVKGTIAKDREGKYYIDVKSIEEVE